MKNKGNYSLNNKPFLKESFQNAFLVSLNPRINSAGIRYGQAASKERIRHKEKYSGTIHPYSEFRWYWDILMTPILIFSLIEKPVQIAFNSFHDHDYPLVIAISFITSSTFFLDIIFNFITGIPDTKSDTVILDKAVISRKYLKSWFLIDLLSSIPFDSLYYFLSLFEPAAILEGHDVYFQIIRLLGLLKFFRIFRVVQCLERIERAFHISENYIRLINVIFGILTILHWLTCLHWLVTDLFNNFQETPKQFSWITVAKLWSKPDWYCYINACLRAFSNMAGNGYGAGGTPSEPEDIIVTIVSMALGYTCFGLYISTVTTIIKDGMDVSEKKFEEMILEVEEYMRFRNAEKKLQKRMRKYYRQKFKRSYFDERMILGSISNVLEMEILMCNCKHLLENVPLFRELPDSFLKRIVKKLKFQLYLPGDRIIAYGSEGNAMYFIQEGIVNVTTEREELINTLKSGSYFGEGALVSEDPKRNANVTAKDYCDIYLLERKDFQDVFRDHEDILENIKSVAKQRKLETNCKSSQPFNSPLTG